MLHADILNVAVRWRSGNVTRRAVLTSLHDLLHERHTTEKGSLVNNSSQLQQCTTPPILHTQ